MRENAPSETTAFDPYDLTTYAGRRFAFADHANASFFGMGPWQLADGESGKSPNGLAVALRFVPVADGFAHSQWVVVWPADVRSTFDTSEEETVPDEATTDERAVMAHIHSIRNSEEAGEISDTCARVIASWHAEGMGAGQAFASTGAIVGGSTAVWRDLFGNGHYDRLGADDKLAADMLGTYLLNREDDGPVEGWSGLWIR